MWLFLASLVMVFLSGMFAYIFMRVAGPRSPALGTIDFSWLLWVSTVVILITSVTIHLALAAVRRQKIEQMKVWLLVTLGLSIVFCVIQTPALLQLVNEHVRLQSQPGGTTFYGLVFFMIFLHAAHVIGGLIYLLRVCLLAFSGKYDHEHYTGVKHAVMYWHFLDIVWIVMFGTMVIMG